MKGFRVILIVIAMPLSVALAAYLPTLEPTKQPETSTEDLSLPWFKMPLHTSRFLNLLVKLCKKIYQTTRSFEKANEDETLKEQAQHTNKIVDSPCGLGNDNKRCKGVIIQGITPTKQHIEKEKITDHVTDPEEQTYKTIGTIADETRKEQAPTTKKLYDEDVFKVKKHPNELKRNKKQSKQSKQIKSEYQRNGNSNYGYRQFETEGTQYERLSQRIKEIQTKIANLPKQDNSAQEVKIVEKPGDSNKIQTERVVRQIEELATPKYCNKNRKATDVQAVNAKISEKQGSYHLQAKILPTTANKNEDNQEEMTKIQTSTSKTINKANIAHSNVINEVGGLKTAKSYENLSKTTESPIMWLIEDSDILDKIQSYKFILNVTGSINFIKTQRNNAEETKTQGMAAEKKAVAWREKDETESKAKNIEEPSKRVRREESSDALNEYITSKRVLLLDLLADIPNNEYGFIQKRYIKFGTWLGSLI